MGQHYNDLHKIFHVTLAEFFSLYALPDQLDLARYGMVKGKCALGPFLSILVIECQHKWTHVNLCKVMDKVQIK
jgi:hypothetical protein